MPSQPMAALSLEWQPQPLGSPSLSATQTPERQVPPLQGVPSKAGTVAQVPVVGSQALDSWHSPGAGQVTGVPAQTFAPHTSWVVHRSPSSQLRPSRSFWTRHMPA